MVKIIDLIQTPTKSNITYNTVTKIQLLATTITTKTPNSTSMFSREQRGGRFSYATLAVVDEVKLSADCITRTLNSGHRWPGKSRVELPSEEVLGSRCATRPNPED